MTLRERADKIASHAITRRCTGDGEFFGFVKEIEFALQEVRRETLEEAAKVAEAMIGGVKYPYNGTADMICKAIRALAQK